MLGTIIGTATFSLAALFILFVLQFVGSLIFSFASFLVNIVLEFNFRILDPTNAIVTIGWEITRDIANLGFVLVIILIALATIVRYQDYGAKKLLPRLIGAAILVNFSLSIAGIFIGFSNIITNYFMNATSTGGVVEFTETLSGAFNPQNLFTAQDEPTPFDPDEEAGWFEGLSTAVLMNIGGLFFTVIFTFVAAFVLFAFAIMLLIRYVELSILLILAPIAWLFWVIPQLQDQFSKWWRNFMRWVFFAPAVSFFFYLALVSIEQINKGMGAVSKDVFFKDGALSALANQGVRMVILTGFLVGGLIVADSMGITGAKKALALAKTGSNNARKWAQKRASATGAAVGRRALTARTDEKGKTGLNRLATRIEGSQLGKWVPGLTETSRKLSVASSKAQATGKKNVDEKKKGYDDWTKEDLAAEMNYLPSSGNMEENAARGLALAEKGGWDLLDEEAKKRVIDALKSTKKGDDILMHVPQLYKEFGKTGEEIAAKLDKLPKGNESAEFKKFLEEYAQYLNQGIIDQIGSTSLPHGDDLRTAIKTSLKTHAPRHADVEKYRTDVKALVEDIDAITSEIENLQAKIEVATTNKAKNILRGIVQKKTSEKRKLVDKKKTMNKEIERIKDSLSPDERRAFDRLENINKQPNYKSIP